MARPIHGVRLVILASAGIGAFYAAAHMSGQSTTDAVSVVAPALQRDRIGLAGTAPGLPEPVAPAASRSASAASAPSPAALPARADRSEAIPAETGQPFTAMSWVVAPPPPRPVAMVAAPPAPPPVAPPLPFTFVGLVEKGTPKPQAFLSRGDELLVVSPGDLLDGGKYRVEVVNATQIVFVHLPTNTKQVINLSGGSQ